MEPSTWTTIYLPMFIVFLFIMSAQRRKKIVLFKIMKKKRRFYEMTNEMIEKLVDKNCWIICFESSANVQGRITKIADNWIEVQTKKGTEMVNAEFVAKFKML